jgi:hypothetical protein
LVVGGWVLVVGGQHLAARLRITHPVPDNLEATHYDAVTNHQPPTTLFRLNPRAAAEIRCRACVF